MLSALVLQMWRSSLWDTFEQPTSYVREVSHRMSLSGSECRYGGKALGGFNTGAARMPTDDLAVRAKGRSSGQGMPRACVAWLGQISLALSMVKVQM